MAVFLFLVASIGGVVVADLLLENPTAGEATVFNQPISGYRQGELLAMAAALGFVVAVLLVASVSSTPRQRARPQAAPRIPRRPATPSGRARAGPGRPAG
jgi:hypothetical protein